MGFFNDPDDHDRDAGFRSGPLPVPVWGDVSIKSSPVVAWSPEDDGASLQVRYSPGGCHYVVTGTRQSVAEFAASWNQMLDSRRDVDVTHPEPEKFRAEVSPHGYVRISSGWMGYREDGKLLYPIDVMRPLLDGVYGGVRLASYAECPLYARILRERALV